MKMLSVAESSRFMSDLMGETAAGRCRTRMRRHSMKLRHKEPRYRNYDTYLRHALGCRTSGCLVPSPQFDSEESRLAAATQTRLERMRELVEMQTSMSQEAREIMQAQFRDSLSACDPAGSGVRPALSTLLTQSIVNDIYARLNILDFVLKDPVRENTPEFITSSIQSLNRLSSDMMSVDLTVNEDTTT